MLASEGKGNIFPSKLEILFLLETGASISVLNLPTIHVIAKQLNLNVPKLIENKRAKTLTVSNQTEVPMIHYVSMTCYRLPTKYYGLSRTTSKTPYKNTFFDIYRKGLPYISYIYTIKCKEPIHFKPRSGKTIHFPIKNYLNLHFELEDNTKFYPSNPYTYFLQKFKDVFYFLDMIVNDKGKDSCSTAFQNFTSHPATLPRGIIEYIENPITQTTPPHYRVHDVDSLVYSVRHAYHPDTTIPIRQNDYTDMNLCTQVIPQS